MAEKQNDAMASKRKSGRENISLNGAITLPLTSGWLVMVCASNLLRIGCISNTPTPMATTIAIVTSRQS